MTDLLGKMHFGEDCVDAIFNPINVGRFKFTIFIKNDISAYIMDVVTPIRVNIDGVEADAVILSITDEGPTQFGTIYRGEIECFVY